MEQYAHIVLFFLDFPAVLKQNAVSCLSLFVVLHMMFYYAAVFECHSELTELSSELNNCSVSV